MYAEVEQLRLNYIKCNQPKIIVELYNRLAEAISSGDSNPVEFGRTMILLTSFTSSSSKISELYQGSMSIVKKYRNPECSLQLHVTLNGNKFLPLLCQIRCQPIFLVWSLECLEWGFVRCLNDIWTHYVLVRLLYVFKELNFKIMVYLMHTFWEIYQHRINPESHLTKIKSYVQKSLMLLWHHDCMWNVD